MKSIKNIFRTSAGENGDLPERSPDDGHSEEIGQVIQPESEQKKRKEEKKNG